MNRMERKMQIASAGSILGQCRVPLNADFHTLRSEQVERLLEYADAHNYRKPKNANGSRARYFHARLQRLALSATSD